jgi:hypothetical protein
MAERRPDTLADLGDNHAIYSDCRPCNRSIRLNTQRLAAMYGTELTLAEFKYRLTCRECGARPRQVRITYVVPSR